MTVQARTPRVLALSVGRRRGAQLAATALGFVLLAACSSGSPSTVAVSAGGASASAGGAAAFAAYRECMQAHGVTLGAGPRPTAGETGGPNGGPGGQPNSGQPNSGQPDSGADSAANQACASLRPTGGFGGNGGGISPTVLTAFRSCLTDHGVKLPTTAPTPGPTPTNSADRRGSGGFLAGLDQKDPTVAKALKVCQALLPTRGPGGAGSATPS